ncbi:hypothetical protein QTI24_22735 [Variovorax sp. J22P240]|uniref:hypothetical protein n=1 Tax=Variovorax sp. J22R115 TaxID=3053509 RepID=UPI002577CCD2|nr:hypothetical protein [Variovorax sp. J22R115]MDM0001438.1 hypothetical protein [Variovorax sp. J22P240]
MSMYVLSQTLFRRRISSASVGEASAGTCSSKLVGDQKRFQIEGGRAGGGVIGTEITPPRTSLGKAEHLHLLMDAHPLS